MGINAPNLLVRQAAGKQKQEVLFVFGVVILAEKPKKDSEH
jgi:hypothetical protein